MLRQNFEQAGQTTGIKNEAELLVHTADNEALRAAYLMVAGQSGSVLSGKTIKSALTFMGSEPPYTGQEPFSANSNRVPESKPSRQPYNFLVGLETEAAYARKAGLPKDFHYRQAVVSKPSAQTKLPPIPQSLLGDLKPYSPESQESPIHGSQVETLSLNRQQTYSPPVRQKRLHTDQKLDNPQKFSFASFLTENPTLTFSAAEVPIERDADWVDRYQRHKSARVKLLERLKLLLGILGLGLVGCSVYIALSYWWFGSSPVSQAAEPVSMLNVQDDSAAGDQNATSIFNNIHSIQQDAKHKNQKYLQPKPSNSETEGILLTQPHPAPAPKSEAATNEPIKYEPTGRPDPFAPLVTTGGALSGKSEVKAKQDLFSEISYNGFIGDINSPDKVAIIKVNDTTNNTAKTYIKKAGESISINSERVTVKAISKKDLLMGSSSEVRHLPMQQYQSLKPNPTGASNAAPNGMGGPATGQQNSPSPYGSGTMGGNPTASIGVAA